MSQTTNDIDMLDTIVSSITNPTSQLVKVAMQNNVHNDPTTPIKNHSTTNNTTLPSEKISSNPSINHNLKQDLSSRSAYPQRPKHVSQMAMTEEHPSRMAKNPVHAKDLGTQPINSTLGDSNDMQKISPIITLSTNPSLIPNSSSSPDLELLSNLNTDHNANITIIPKEEIKTSPNSSTNQNHHGKPPTSPTSTSKPSNSLCSTTSSSKL
uniref:Uncharacterized serine-rich protein C215.13-like n=2 Tax=Nicotiana TaxID=4085 RepID=A0A1S3Y0T9_TOBAC|nr:PREDICTED: uncharacterized serine-rich protein C215.13-like [Nicotiana sylvestris]XP_016445592.1 PREDICTED: uncharacterized serine-rich protein C215.13-like [Nicotiana tabacum]